MDIDIKYMIIVCLFLWVGVAYIIDSFTGDIERELNLFSGILSAIFVSAAILTLF